MKEGLEEKIKRLSKISPSSFPILNVYLGERSKKTPAWQIFLIQFHSLIKENLNSDQKKLFRQDIQRIESYLRESFDTHGNRSVVFFSSSRNLWEVLSFEFYLKPVLKVSNNLLLKPIIDAFKNYEKYLVILADRKRAKFFTVHLGRIERVEEILNGQVPQRVSSVHELLGREDKVYRHIEDHLRSHLAFLAQRASEFARKNKIKFIILGEHKEIFKKIKRELPWRLKKKIKGEFVTELDVPLNKLLLASKRVVEKLYKK